MELARKYAAGDIARTGRPWRGFVEEFEHGWAIWTYPSEDVAPPIGTGNKTVLDRETGHISHWPAWTIETLAQTYAAHRPNIRQVNQNQPRSNISLAASPAALQHLRNFATLTAPDGRIWCQFNALADPLQGHHPLVAQWFAGQPRQSLVRGADRHCIMWLFSGALHDLAPEELASCQIRSAMPCATCIAACVHFGVSDPALLAALTPTSGDIELGAQSFPDGTPFDPTVWAEIAFRMLEEERQFGEPIPRVEAARPILERFPVAISPRRGPGLETYIQPFHLGVNNRMCLHSQLLARFGTLIGAPVFPVGQIDPDGLIVVDGHGRLFVLDEGGAWYCGRDIDTALRMLHEGLEMPRVRADGSVSF